MVWVSAAPSALFLLFAHVTGPTKYHITLPYLDVTFM